MRKNAAILLLLALSACTPVPAPTPTAAPTHETEPLPPYHPSVGFHIESTWTSKFDDSDGRAILELGKDEDGLVPFHVYLYQYERDSVGTLVTHMDDFSAVLAEDSRFSVENTTDDFYTGTLDINDDTIFLACDWDTERPCPTRFTRLSEPTASTIWYDMPLFIEDIRLPVPLATDHETIVSVLGEPVSRLVDRDSQRAFVQYQYDNIEIRGELHPPDSEEGYCVIGSYTSSDPNRIPQVRGIQVGDSADSVLARFPNDTGFSSLWDIASARSTQEIYLYGQLGTPHYEGRIRFQDGRPASIIYSCGPIIAFDLDADGRVSAISISQEL